MDVLISFEHGFEFDTRNAADTFTRDSGANFFQVGEPFVKTFEKPVAQLHRQTVRLAKLVESGLKRGLWFARVRGELALLRDECSQRIVADFEPGVNRL